MNTKENIPSTRMPSIAISGTSFIRLMENLRRDILALVSDDIAFSGTNLRFILKKIKYPSLSMMFKKLSVTL